MPPETPEPEAKKAEAKPAEKASAGATRTKRIVTGAAIGIGSAALVAALLYANRSRKATRPRVRTQTGSAFAISRIRSSTAGCSGWVNSQV